jgi:hypothetical protein
MLLKKDISINRNILLLFFTAFLLLEMLISLLYPLLYRNYYFQEIYQPHIAVILVLMTMAISFSFYELDFDEKKTGFLTLPATQLEKYLCRWLETFLGYFLIGVVLYTINCIFVWGLNIPQIAGYRHQYVILNPGNYDFGKAALYYVLLHSIFFFGAVYFKKNEYIKTIIFIIVIVAAALSVLKILHQIFIPELNVSFFLLTGGNDMGVWPKVEEYNKYAGNMLNMLNVLLFLIPPFLWILGYFRFKEEEAVSGVQ